MIWQFAAAGLLAAVGAGVHTWAGERRDIRNLMSSSVPAGYKLELRAVWHLFGATMLVCAAALFLLSFNRVLEPAGLFGQSIAMLFAVYGVMIAATLLMIQPRRLFRVPQWLVMLAIAGLAWWGSI